MIVHLNGKPAELPAGLTIAGLVEKKGLNPDTVIIEYNYQLVGKEAWPGITLKENDRLEVLRFVGGG
ncbi:thiamine biosynthesis protein ThiS [Desulfotomaculum copahuensis]|uniref:Thiamine biosynthesis protein ThiS n=1 Tax=Desulfotomaculum copahuensis TaxID=1838280 RepID=A0A1B7LG87_9FIRM|nr:sulfur carrier protein ThiS [Desulfotomaculum copahuensis]OAT84988.1 thiamine biosynthesis protein ThiS [Desulfotomaculum copahuensis]